MEEEPAQLAAIYPLTVKSRGQAWDIRLTEGDQPMGIVGSGNVGRWADLYWLGA